MTIFITMLSGALLFEAISRPETFKILTAVFALAVSFKLHMDTFKK